MTKTSKLFASAPRAELLASAANAASPTEPKSKSRQPRYAKLDGKPPSRPRGRHASKGAPPANRETIRIPVDQRLGFRPSEYAGLIGVSDVTVWRGIRDGKIPFVDHLGLKFIPRWFTVSVGFINADDQV